MCVCTRMGMCHLLHLSHLSTLLPSMMRHKYVTTVFCAILPTFVRAHTHTHTHKHTQTHTNTHSHTHTLTCTQPHRHTHTHTHTVCSVDPHHPRSRLHLHAVPFSYRPSNRIHPSLALATSFAETEPRSIRVPHGQQTCVMCVCVRVCVYVMCVNMCVCM